jgi:signal peptidase I
MPTLLIGDYFVAERGYFRRQAPRRGELAVFRWPRDRRFDFVKRIIALPGDRVRLRAGVVYINDAPIAREPAGHFSDPEFQRAMVQYVETAADGHHYRIVKVGEGQPLDNTAEVIVPADHYFVLGDNRDNSADSRDPWSGVGLVARADLTDRPYLIYWSRSHERIGTPLE